MAARARRSRTASRTPASCASTDERRQYRATYTAFDGAPIAPQLIETERLPALPDLPARRAGRAEQGHGAVPAHGRRPVRRAVALGPGEQRHRHLRRRAWWGDARTLQTPSRRGNCIQTRQLRLAGGDRGGLARPHPRGRADARVRHRCAAARPRRPEPRHRRAARPAAGARRTTSATATSPTSSTPAARCATATGCCCPTGRATRRCGSRSSTCRLLVETADAAGIRAAASAMRANSSA